MKPSHGFLLLVLLSVCAGSISAQEIHVSIGHGDQVNDLAAHPELPYLFSVGDDGALLIWDLDKEQLHRRVALSPSPLTMVEHHPTRNELLIHARDSVLSGRIIAYDWEDEQVLFESPVDSSPIYLGYSPGGTFAIVAVPDFDSLTFFSAQTGNIRPYLTEGFGAVSFLIVARSEQNIMTYLPSRGEFIYWELRSGRELQVVDTRARLEHMTFVAPETQRFLAAADEENLLIIDNVTGEVESSYAVTPIRDITFSAASNRIYVLSERFGRPNVLAFSQQNGRLRRETFQSRHVDETTNVIQALEVDGIALGGGAADGAVTSYAESSGQRTALGPAAPPSVEGLAFAEGQLHLAIRDRLVTLNSDLFEPTTSARNGGGTGDNDGGARAGNDNEVRPGAGSGGRQAIRVSNFESRIRSVGDLTSFAIGGSPDGVLMWGPQRPGQVWVVSNQSESTETLYDDSDRNAVKEAKWTVDGLLVIHSNGTIVHVPFVADREGFRYRATGVRDAVWDPDLGLVIARTRSELLPSSLIVVDPFTGETAAVDEEAFATNEVEIDHEQNAVFAVSLVREGDRQITEVRRYSGEGLSTTMVLLEQEGENLFGSISWDPEHRELYSTIGTLRLAILSPSGVTTIGPAMRNALRIAVGEDVVAAANSDGSVSLYWKETKTFVGDVYFLENEWIFVTDNSFMASSRRMNSYIAVGGALGSDLDAYRLQLPLLIQPDF